MRHIARRLELAKLDIWHQMRGDYEEWMLSEERTYFADDQKVRIVTSRNIEEICRKSGLPMEKLRAAHKEAVETGDVVIVTYDEDSDG